MRQLDVYVGTLILLTVSAIILAIMSWFTEDSALWQQVTLRTVGFFGLAGFIHFFLGWTVLSLSQRRVGAARTSALMGATPLFGTLIGLLLFNEVLDLPVLIGILLVITGVYIVATG